MVLLLMVLYDPLLLFSYLIYYILYVGYDAGIILYCIVGYDAGGYIIVGGVAGVIYYIVIGYDEYDILY